MLGSLHAQIVKAITTIVLERYSESLDVWHGFDAF